MSENTIKARISQLHKTEAEWSVLPNFIPRSGEIIIFDPDEQFEYSRVKIGNGITELSQLPFLVDSAITKYFNGVLDCGCITD